MADDPATVLDELDGERPGEPFTVRAGGHIITLRPAAGPPWRDLMDALCWPPDFLTLFGPDDPGEVAVLEGLSVVQMRALLHGWRVHHGLCPKYDDNLRLVSMLGKPAYRAAAERDLWEVHRLSLTAEWQARRWRQLLNLLNGLRRTSHTHEAMTLDEEMAELFLEQELRGEVEKAKKAKRRMTEFSVEAELLSFAVDRLGELIVAQATGRGGRRRKVEPMPRPESALHRVRQRRARSKHQYTVARVFGYIDKDGNPTGRPPKGTGTS